MSYLIPFVNKVSAYETNLQLLEGSYYFPKFKKMKELWSSFNSELSYVNVTMLCSGSALCAMVLNDTSGYGSKGMMIGIQLIAQKYLEVIADYGSFSKTDFGGAELKKFLKEKEFNVLTQNVEFMLSAVQSTVYATFRVDYMKVKQNLARTMIMTNLLMICIQLLSNIIIYILLLYLRNKIIYVHYGSIKFNDSFNKSLKYCN